MPKEARKKIATHERPIALKDPRHRTDDGQTMFPVDETDPKNKSSGRGSWGEEVKPTKKERQALKHETLLRRIQSFRSPHSKSHERRMKRKAQEQIASGLSEIQHAIAAVETEEPSVEVGTHISDASHPPGGNLMLGHIGNGRSTTLTKSQRKHALQLERMRVPLILSNPQFADNPFQTLRTHAENTLIKHLPSPQPTP